jgi:hypothetical protein
MKSVKYLNQPIVQHKVRTKPDLRIHRNLLDWLEKTLGRMPKAFDLI